MKDRPKFYQSVLFKMLVRSILMIIATLGLVELISYRLSSSQITDLTIAQMVALTKNYQSEYDRAVNAMDAELALLSSTPALFNYFKNKQFDLEEEAGQSIREVSSFFKEAMSRSPLMKSVRLVDTRNKIITESKKTQVSPGFVAEIPETGVFFDNATQSYLISIRKDVKDEGGKVGMVEVLYDFDGFTDKLRHEKMFEHGHLAVITKSGRAVTFPGYKPGDAIDAKLLEEINLHHSDALGAFEHGEIDKSLVSAASLTVKPWYVVSVVPQSEMFAVLMKLRNIIVGIVAINICVELLMLTYFVRRLISRPVNNIVHFAELITGGNYNLEIKSTVKDEIGILARKFDQMRLAIKEKIEIIERYNAELEQRVADRTRALEMKTKETQLMLDNLNQGIFLITSDFKIDQQYSVYLEEIFETKEFRGSNPMELLMKDSNFNASHAQQIQSSLSNIIGGSSLELTLNEDGLPRELTKQFGDRLKILEVDWVPIMTPEDSVERMMVIVRDVTELRSIMESARRADEEIQALGKMIMQGNDRMLAFFNESERYVADAKAALEDTALSPMEIIQKVFLGLHTVKGNSRIIGLAGLVDVVHAAESYLAQFREPGKAGEMDLRHMGSEVEKVRIALEHARKLYGKTIRTDSSSFKKDTFLKQLDKMLVDYRAKGRQLADSILARIQTDREISKALKLDAAIQGPVDSLKSIAREIGKPIPGVVIEGADVLFRDETARKLTDVFMHLLRNSIDHGIEAQDERVAKGKTPEGEIRLRIADGAKGIVIQYRDDGRGLNVGKLAAIARTKLGADPKTPSDVGRMIFEDGVSTATKVTQLSGRGVGMSAVREFLRGMGGDIEVEMASTGKLTDEYCAFQFNLSLPKELLIPKEWLADEGQTAMAA